MQPIVFVLGKPGCGKGTTCQYLAQHLPIAAFSAGDLLRLEVANNPNSPVSQTIQDCMKAGSIVDPRITVALLKNAINNCPNARGFLIDGFPREPEQFEFFKTQFDENRCYLMHLCCSDEECIRRIKGRNSGRIDDNDKTIMARLVHFQEQTLQVINQFAQKGRLIEVDAKVKKEELGTNAQLRLNSLVENDSVLRTRFLLSGSQIINE